MFEALAEGPADCKFMELVHLWPAYEYSTEFREP